MFVAVLALAQLATWGGLACLGPAHGPPVGEDPAAGRSQVVVDAREITIQTGTRPILRYRYTDVPFKTYVRELFSPGGVNVLRDAPADHRHHHGLMFALGVGDTTFWSEEDGAGRQLPQTNTHVDVRDGRAGFSALIPWVDGKQVVLREYRQIRALTTPDDQNVTLINWRSSLMPDSVATLTGSHYYGLGMRFVAEMDGSGEFTNSSGRPGEVFRGDERLVRANWCAYTAPVDGQPITVAMFDHPDNRRYPATWFTMSKPFAYLSATLSLHTRPLTIEKGETLDLYYGVAVWDGRVEAKRIDQVYKHWLSACERPVSQGALNDR